VVVKTYLDTPAQLKEKSGERGEGGEGLGNL
jgi:hypothetical protein